MGTKVYFEENITDQNGENTMFFEFGCSSFYSGCPVPSGIGTDSIYLKVEDKHVIMDRDTAKKFIEAAMAVGSYFSLID